MSKKLTEYERHLKIITECRKGIESLLKGEETNRGFRCLDRLIEEETIDNQEARELWKIKI